MVVSGSSSPAQYPTLVIGAGPAGLAVAACLKRAGLPCLVLEQAAEVGSSWRNHYDRLHLHTDKAHSALPYMPFPEAYPRYPSRTQVVAYLEAYAQTFGLEVRFNEQVVSARAGDGFWNIQTQKYRYRVDNLIVAAGYNREPHRPVWPGQASFRGTLLHSSAYRSGGPFRNQRVLVVGFGNSGGEIALDLWEHGAKPSLAVRGAVNVVPRDLLGMPTVTLALAERGLPPRLADTLNAPLLRAALGDLRTHGLRAPPYGALTQIRRSGRIPVIDVGTISLIRRGEVPVYPGLARFTRDGVVFLDEQARAFDAVILATGYRPRVDVFLEGAKAACDRSGIPLTSGDVSPLPGLYFCGYHVTGTGMLREIALEAKRIAASLAREA